MPQCALDQFTQNALEHECGFRGGGQYGEGNPNNPLSSAWWQQEKASSRSRIREEQPSAQVSWRSTLPELRCGGSAGVSCVPGRPNEQ